MSTTIQRPPRKTAEPERTAPPIEQTAAPSTVGLGLAPRVDLLPASLRIRRRQKRLRRRLVAGLAAVVILSGAGIAGASFFAASAQTQLADAQDETLSLLTERGRYTEVAKAQDGIALGEAAQAVGAGTEVDWAGYLARLAATLPDGATLTGVTVDSSSPMLVYPQGTTPLEGPRIATLTFTAVSPTLPDVPEWLDALAGLPAVVDAVPDSVTRNEDGAYVVNMTLHVGPEAYTGRFAPEEGGAR